MLMAVATIDSQSLYPGFLVFISTLLIMLLLVSLMGGNWRVTLQTRACDVKWLGLAVALAVIYWQLDHWFFMWLDADQMTTSQQQWHINQAAYLSWSVFAGTVVLAPLVEEVFFRGLLFNTLQVHFRAHWVIALSAGFFALIHPSWPLVVSVFLAGMMYGWLRYRAGSVLPAVLAHFIHNAMTFWLYAGV
ncbi:CPBP family intramembrane glutamic endopeptidase [Marinicella sediminis]|uniref:CPBP family intramembrane glutamic endopeptidase n=2 Tax=Marinicella sediminis TaxID=1792834 RepID=A0ABV7J5Z5_9GAMM